MTYTALDFSFNGTSALTKSFETHAIYKTIMPAVQETIISIPGKDGITQASKKFGSRKITILGKLTGTDYANLITNIQALAAFLYSDEDKDLILNNESDRHYNAQHMALIEIEKKNTFVKFELQFNCNDPFGYAETQDTVTASITADGQQVAINNGGHYYAFPEITITFNQVQSHIFIENEGILGNRLDISKAFQAADELVINCKDGTIKLNAADSPAGFGDGGEESAEFIMLASGSNLIKFGTDDPTIDCDIEIVFYKVYLS